MSYNHSWIFIIIISFSACQKKIEETIQSTSSSPSIGSILDLDGANRLARLPLKCIDTKLPYKPGITITEPGDLLMPHEEHPAFYGCFDWHSAVHGHWSLVYLLKTFPKLELANEARTKLNVHLTTEHIQKEIDYFKKNKYTKSFERTYGWAWILKLQEELITWDDPSGQKWAANLQPLADYISSAYQEYLPKLVYPIRVGEHTNTAFGLSFAIDYAKTVNDTTLWHLISRTAMRFYEDDKACPITWEPSGYDFLSPCLQEIDIMRKVLPSEYFTVWLNNFLPPLGEGNLSIEPGKVLDRSDGKLVHLDGVNFSRAWCLYPLLDYPAALEIAHEHMNYSLGNVTDGDYAGEHWLASFALYAFKTQKESVR